MFLSQAENNIEASRQERVRAEQMQTEIKQRERLTEELQEKTSLLSQQYLEAQEEVNIDMMESMTILPLLLHLSLPHFLSPSLSLPQADRQRSIVSSLETQLVSSNSQCHVLQQEVSHFVSSLAF